MKEQLNQLDEQMVIVIVPIRNDISISIQGHLEGWNGDYHIPGNPAIKFNWRDVNFIDTAVTIPTIRLKG